MRVSFADMKKEFKKVLIKKGFNEEKADIASQLFTETSCDGVYSHGVNRFPRVISYLEKGYIVPDAEPTLEASFGAFERWNGNLGMGNVNAKICMDRAIELAQKNGIGCVALRNTNHWMRGGSYGLQAADAGCIGICWTNTQPNMPAWGATDRRIGNNPLIICIPKEGGQHILCDAAMAQFSYGVIENFKLMGKQLPVPGGYDEEGNLTTDPASIEKTWRVLPIGFWKGSGFSIVMDLIAAILSGGNSTYKVGLLGGDEYQLSQILIAINAKGIAGEEYLNGVIKEVLNDIKASDRINPNAEILYPGEKELDVRKTNLENGIPVNDDVWNSILDMLK